MVARGDWMVCRVTLGGKSLIGLSRYMQKYHFACPRPQHVISLTHAIKCYLCEQITNLNPWPPRFTSRAVLRDAGPSRWTNNNPFSSTGSCSPPFAAMQRREERYRTCLILFRDDHSSHLQEDSTTARGTRTAAKHWPFERVCVHF